MPSVPNTSPIAPTPHVAGTALGPVEYIDSGSGPVVVTLHGAMGGCDQSLILGDTVLGAPFRVLAVSRPGYLGTPLASGFTSAQQADLVAALLDSLHIEHAAVIGISGGGPCTISFALRHPARCRAAVLISTVAGINRTPIPFSFHITCFLARFAWVVRSMKKKALANLDKAAERSIEDPEVRKQMLSNPETRALFERLMSSTLDRMGERIAGTRNDIHITRTTEYPLEQISVPTLIVHGTADRMVDHAQNARVLATRIPGAQLLSVPRGEHVTIFTHRDLVRNAVTEFIQARTP